MKNTRPEFLQYTNFKKAITDGIICSAGFAVFAYFIIFPFPVKSVAFIPLLISSFVISKNLNLQNWTVTNFTKGFLLYPIWVYSLIGMLMGLAGAMYYRGSFGMPVLPAVIRGFTIVAICIGIMEELVFRGFVQSRLSSFHPGFAIVFAALAHATYKASLFLSPAAQNHPATYLFFTWSFGAFILIGLLRHYSKSIIPAIMVHAVFDLIVYAENLQAPWWVW